MLLALSMIPTLTIPTAAAGIHSLPIQASAFDPAADPIANPFGALESAVAYLQMDEPTRMEVDQNAAIDNGPSVLDKAQQAVFQLAGMQDVLNPEDIDYALSLIGQIQLVQPEFSNGGLSLPEIPTQPDQPETPDIPEAGEETIPEDKVEENTSETPAESEPEVETPAETPAETPDEQPAEETEPETTESTVETAPETSEEQQPESKPETTPGKTESAPAPEKKEPAETFESKDINAASPVLNDTDHSFYLDARPVVNAKVLISRENKKMNIASLGEFMLLPEFDNAKAWKESVSSYNTPYLWGQCTWFAWGRFFELYGFDPQFSGNGYQCADQLLKAHPDKFEKSDTPKAGAIFSSDLAYNHVGIILDVDEKTGLLTVQEGNLDGRSNADWKEAIEDYRTIQISQDDLETLYGDVTYAVPKADTHFASWKTPEQKKAERKARVIGKAQSQLAKRNTADSNKGLSSSIKKIALRFKR